MDGTITHIVQQGSPVWWGMAMDLAALAVQCCWILAVFATLKLIYMIWSEHHENDNNENDNR